MGTPTERFYNTFSFFYPLVEIFLGAQKKILFKLINDLPAGQLLEIGVGNGSHFHLYKKHNVTGIDTSAGMLAIARKKNPGKVQLLQMSGTALASDSARFDYVVLSHVIAVVDDPEKLLKEVQRVLKPKGQVFILNHFTPDNWLRYVDHAFKGVAKLFQFRSIFCIDQLASIKNFRLLKEISFGAGAYFKLLIYQKK